MSKVDVRLTEVGAREGGGGGEGGGSGAGGWMGAEERLGCIRKVHIV